MFAFVLVAAPVKTDALTSKKYGFLSTYGIQQLLHDVLYTISINVKLSKSNEEKVNGSPSISLHKPWTKTFNI